MERAEAVALQTVATLSTLLTAMEVRYRASERRAGRDPSDQEPAPEAYAYLIEAAAELEQLLTQLDRSTMYAGHYEEDYLTAAVRRFDDLVRLNRTAVLLHSIHQRLLSLYPAVSEQLIEQARLLQVECRDVTDTEEETFTSRLSILVENGRRLVILIRDELST
ncbi:MAG TPA: hypothetical protein VFG50_05045 [Rhodothermales bacterium]|nr:hypothetical protein [Rhodothermales bacterium]